MKTPPPITHVYDIPVGELRIRFAEAALNGLLSDPMELSSQRNEGETCIKATARLAVEHADALIAELSKR